MGMYIVGDTHGGVNGAKLQSANFPRYNECSKDDILLQVGDFGYIWSGWTDKTLAKELKCIEYVFHNRKFGEVLFVDGNHENFELLKKFPTEERYGGLVRRITDNVFQLLRGEVYTIQGKKIFAFGGASSTDKEYRVMGKTWFPDEDCSCNDRDNALTNLEKHDFEVDIILTHTCARTTLNQICEYYHRPILEYDSHNEFLEEVKSIVRYKKWFFGHIHIDLQINEKETCVFNKVLYIE